MRLHSRDAQVSSGSQAIRQQPLPAKLMRVCPRCGAGIGKSCRRWVSGIVGGVDYGGGYWRPLKIKHDER